MRRLTDGASRLYLAVSIAAAVIAALSLFLYLRDVQARAVQGGRLVSVVVAARNMEAGEVIDTASLRLVDFPERYLLSGFFTDPGEVVGGSLLSAVGEGEPLLATSLLSPGEGGFPDSSLEREFRAYPLPASSVSFPAAGLREGSRVDILALAGEAATILLESVEVINVYGGHDAFVEGNAAALDGASPCILLKLTPEEACRLAGAREGGDVELLLRPD